MFVETFPKARFVIGRQFPLRMSPDLIKHTAKINQTADLFAGTAQTYIFHVRGLVLKKNALGLSRQNFEVLAGVYTTYSFFRIFPCAFHARVAAVGLSRARPLARHCEPMAVDFS